MKFQREEQILDEIVLLLSSLNESEDNTFEWDLTVGKIDKSLLGIDNPNKAKSYLGMFFNKIKGLPRLVRGKLAKYVCVFMLTFLAPSAIISFIPSDLPEVTAAIEAEATPEAAVYQAPRKSSASLVDFLKHEEGSARHKGEPVLQVYKLGDGMVTVGWGHAEALRRTDRKVGDVITRDEAEKLLASDIAEAEKYLNNILNKWDEKKIDVKITQGMYDSMVSMIFNMGIGNFRKSRFIQLVKKGKYKKAQERIHKTCVSYPGHVKRRAKEAGLFGKDMPLQESSINHIRKIIRESIKSHLNESVTISPDEQEYENLNPDLDTLLDLAHLVRDAVAQLYYRYDFFKELVDEGEYKIYNITFFGEGYDERFDYDDAVGPVHDQDIDKLPGDAKEWIIKNVKKRLNDLGIKYTIVPASEIQSGVPGIAWVISENPNAGKSRPQFQLSNSNYSYIFHKLFQVTDQYGGALTVNDVKEVALKLITMGDEFSRSDKIAMKSGGATLYSSSKEDAEYLGRVGRNLLEFAEQCIAQNFNKLSAC